MGFFAAGTGSHRRQAVAVELMFMVDGLLLVTDDGVGVAGCGWRWRVVRVRMDDGWTLPTPRGGH